MGTGLLRLCDIYTATPPLSIILTLYDLIELFYNLSQFNLIQFYSIFHIDIDPVYYSDHLFKPNGIILLTLYQTRPMIAILFIVLAESKYSLRVCCSILIKPSSMFPHQV